MQAAGEDGKTREPGALSQAEGSPVFSQDAEHVYSERAEQPIACLAQGSEVSDD